MHLINHKPSPIEGKKFGELGPLTKKL